jgi:hypothetical protein
MRPLRWLLNSGQEVIFVDKVRPIVEESNQFKFIPYPRIRAERFYSRLGKPISDRIGQWMVQEQLRWIWRWSKADVVHLHWVNARAYQVVRAKLRPLVLSVLGSDINQYFASESSFEDRQKVGYVLKNADIVLVDSEDMIEKCQQLAGGLATVKLFPVGIDTKQFSLEYEEEVANWRKKLHLPTDALVLLSIRALGPIYNHRAILDAFSRAIHYSVKPVYLIMKDYNHHHPAYKIELMEHTQTLGIEPNVRWIEEPIPDSEMPVLYKLANLIINYPHYDAFPVSFIEAAAAARPVISCRLPAYQKTFADKYFKMIEANDFNSLSDGLIEFLNETWKPSPTELVEAQLWIQKSYDESASVKNLISLYQGVISSRN